MSGLQRGITAEELCEVLNITNAQSAIASGWEESEENIPQGIPEFLKPSFLEDACSDFGMDDALTSALMGAGEKASRDPYIARLAWHAYWLAFGAENRRSSLGSWPSFKDNPRTLGDIFYVLISVAGLPKLRKTHAQRGIPKDVADDMLGRIVNILNNFKKRHGQYGMAVNSFSYWTIFFNGELFRIGRLHYHYNPFRGPLRAYRHVASGTVIALSEPDIAYRADGEFYIEQRGDSPVGTWTSTLHETEHTVVGHPIIPTGKCLPGPITLDKAQWTCVLRPGDKVLQMHIPKTGPLGFDECGQSLHEAAVFFNRYFPDRSFKAYAITSWLVDDILEQWLPAESNLVRFLREMYRYPSRGTTRSALHWVFGSVPEDLTKAPRDTTLRERLIDHVLAGGNMVGGGCFLLAGDLNWGSQVYRTQDMGFLDELMKGA